MKFRMLALVLVAAFLLFAGCANKGGSPAATGGATAGTSVGAGNASAGTASGAASGGAGACTGTGSGTSSSVAGSHAGAAGTNGTKDVGNLFRIDTDKPEEGSGYNVPAPGG